MPLKDIPAKFYLSTTFEIKFYDNLCSPYLIGDFLHIFLSPNSGTIALTTAAHIKVG